MVSPDSAAVKSSTGPSTTVQVSAVKSTAYEQRSVSGSVRFSRTGDLKKSLTIFYSVGGTATNGVDYKKLSGSVSLSAGYAAKNVLITPINDKIREGNETVTITISQNPLYTVGSPASATVTIVDND